MLLLEAETIHRDRSDPANLSLCLSQMGHVALAQGKDARRLLEEAERAAEPFYTHEHCPPGRALSKLRRAIDVAGVGEHARLFQGELIESLEDGLRDWLIASGHLDESQARAALAPIEQQRLVTRKARAARNRKRD